MDDGAIIVALLGDVMLGRGVDALIGRRPAAEFWGDALPHLRSADLVIANLESPITNHPGRRHGGAKAFRFRARPAATELLRAGNIGLVNLANNHILDHEPKGLLDTIGHLDAAGIAHVGAGANADAAAAWAMARPRGVAIAALGLTDEMPSFAAGDGPGGNFARLDGDGAALSEIERFVREARGAGAELLVLSVHSGGQLSRRPTGRLRRFARAAIERGIDVIHGHSSHLFQGVERHGGGYILYGTGSGLDDYRVFPGIRIDWSFIFRLDIAGGRPRRLLMIPITVRNRRVELARGREAMRICRIMRRCSAGLGSTVSEDGDGLVI
ncbi:MAG: CapA family protein [Dongiaceae bacterium]